MAYIRPAGLLHLSPSVRNNALGLALALLTIAAIGSLFLVTPFQPPTNGKTIRTSPEFGIAWSETRTAQSPFTEIIVQTPNTEIGILSAAIQKDSGEHLCLNCGLRSFSKPHPGEKTAYPSVNIAYMSGTDTEWTCGHCDVDPNRVLTNWKVSMSALTDFDSIYIRRATLAPAQTAQR